MPVFAARFLVRKVTQIIGLLHFVGLIQNSGYLVQASSFKMQQTEYQKTVQRSTANSLYSRVDPVIITLAFHRVDPVAAVVTGILTNIITFHQNVGITVATANLLEVERLCRPTAAVWCLSINELTQKF